MMRQRARATDLPYMSRFYWHCESPKIFILSLITVLAIGAGAGVVRSLCYRKRVRQCRDIWGSNNRRDCDARLL